MSAAPESVRGDRFETPRVSHTSARHDAPDLDHTAGLVEVEELMRELATVGESELAEAMTLEHMRSGGKRLRARLALAAADAMGASRSDAVVWAAAVELLHNATLVHDDIQDEDLVRRGRATLWARHGIAQAMNAGDLMLMLPYIAVSRLDGRVAGELCRAIALHAIRCVCGQIDELDLLERGRLHWGAYHTAVAGKTGALLALPVFGATLLAGRSTARAEALARCFSDLGVLFQLQDDVLDLYGDKGRGQVGCDLYEGKVSALVVAHLERRPEDKNELVALLRAPRDMTRALDVHQWIRRFASSGALADTVRRINDIESATLEAPALRQVPALREVAAHLVNIATLPIRHCNPPACAAE